MCPRCTQLAKADFDEFVWHDHRGVRFANRMPADGLFLDRRWPVFRLGRRVFDSRWRERKQTAVCGRKVHRSILAAARLTAARRWLPCNPLDAHAMRVEDIRRERRRSR